MSSSYAENLQKERVPGAFVNHGLNMNHQCHPAAEKASTVFRCRNLTAARETLRSE